MATIDLSGKTVGEVFRIGSALAELAATGAGTGGAVDNRVIGTTCTVTDASPAVITVGSTVVRV